jgi:hypothetical protein
LGGLPAFSTALQAQYYDFDSGTDTGWLRSAAHPNTITFPSDTLGGHAYRLQGTPSTSGSETNARVYCYLTNRIYTNFYAAVDVVAWNTNQDCEQVIGLLVRANSNANLGVPSFDPEVPTGLSFNVRLHDYRDYTGPTNNGPLGSADQMSVWGVVGYNGVGSLGNPACVTEMRFRWVPGHAYRLVLSGSNGPAMNPSGYPYQVYTCSIYDVNDLTAPLLTMTGDDSYSGNYMYVPQSGYAGVFAYKLSNGDFDPSVDATFDNFYVGETAPETTVAPPAIPHGKQGAPQVVNRVPASFKNFHPAASGITFNATTLTTTNTINTNATRLCLNGVDVSAGLVISGPATNASVSFLGLVTNVVYNARIVLEDALGRRTTNEWTFDTFTDAYLASSAVKVIEAEDYDFNNGQFIDDPPASGYFNYDPANATGSMVNYDTGYVDHQGVNANPAAGGSPPFDFFDYDSQPHQYEEAYRHSDSVGTQQGNFYLWLGADAAATLIYGQSYETQRSKYSSVNPTLQEYSVERTEGGEWLNYTRVFSGDMSYNAYLRAAGGLAQPVRLDQIAPGPVTNTLGWFNVPSTFYVNNYCYTPLVTTNGALAVVNLSGTNTVRLTMDSLRNNASKQGLAMNYMVFVPAAPQLPPQLYSSATADGSYTPEPNALLDAGKKQFSIPQQGDMRFYRIGWNTQVSIDGISLTGGNVVLSYQ